MKVTYAFSVKGIGAWCGVVLAIVSGCDFRKSPNNVKNGSNADTCTVSVRWVGDADKHYPGFVLFSGPASSLEHDQQLITPEEMKAVLDILLPPSSDKPPTTGVGYVATIVKGRVTRYSVLGNDAHTLKILRRISNILSARRRAAVEMVIERIAFPIEGK